ncbi:hypothetical protein [Paenibacillus cremeus]|uniref:Uncharacterized protein n=1 Tax=Paenibacillus cremeus TaxID=2163881 RepID=A0A559KCW0_9BACL|nr:hypothetical protein [Paenibacillus cremeus]TVY09967.1 hypothetical protein FPZ49_11390 [Paenibacillus cremeus]
MSSINDYKSRVHGTIRNSLLKTTSKIIDNNFTSSPSYYEVLLNSSTTPIGVHIVDDSDVREQKMLLSLHDNPIANGDIITWNSEKWINILTDNMSDVYYRGTLRKCVSSLKWMETGVIKEAWFTYKSDTSRGLGVNDGTVLIMPQERRYIYVQNNADTIKIDKDRRFIIDGRCWRVVGVDRLTTGLVYLELTEDSINPSKDNLDLRLVDYYSSTTPTSTPSPQPSGYSIVVTGSDICKVTQSQTYTANVYLNGVIDNTQTVTWVLVNDSEDGNTDLVTITSQSGTQCVIKGNDNKLYGYCKVKASLVSDGSIFSVKRIQVKSLI